MRALIDLVARTIRPTRLAQLEWIQTVVFWIYGGASEGFRQCKQGVPAASMQMASHIEVL